MTNVESVSKQTLILRPRIPIFYIYVSTTKAQCSTLQRTMFYEMAKMNRGYKKLHVHCCRANHFHFMVAKKIVSINWSTRYM